MIKTVFFDLGNTLVDYHAGGLTDEEKDLLGLWRMHQKILKPGYEITFGELYRTFYERWMIQCAQRNNSKHEFDVLEFLPSVLTKKEKMVLLEEFHEPVVRFAVCLNGVMDVVNELYRRGITLGIISNTPIPGMYHDITLQQLGLIDYFPNRFYSYDIGIRKPHSDLFLHALRKTNANPFESLMVGDRLQLDVLPATQVGMHGLWYVGSNKSQNTSNNEHAIEDFKELLQRIECL
ncbi:MAG TPA: HAD family hydrolase [Chitinispirillaceae bacterium]|nr:HAD family hydrolase [Chitinispirillaceae bacterium]